MTQDIYRIPREKIAQLEELLRRQEIDTLLILSREAGDPILKFLIGVDTVHLGAIFLNSSGKHIVLTSPSDQKKYEESGIFSSVQAYGSSLRDLFLPVFEELAPKRLALNISEDDAICDGLSLGLYRMLEDMVGKERLEAISFSSEPIIKQLRSVKSETEIGLLRESIRITTDIYDEVFSQVKCGMTERQIADLFIAGMKQRGVGNGIGNPYDYPIVCLVRAGLAHRGPGDTASVPGDILIMDFSVRYEEYVSDIARTAYFLRPGETAPPAEIQHAFQTAYDAISATISFIGVGKRGYEVDAVGRKVIEEGGFPTVRHSVGHPIGRECHDSGTALSPRRPGGSTACEGIIQIGETYAIEPTVIQDDGLPCMLVEENVVIREQGAELLSRRQEQLYLIGQE